jgi:hypothetical protein
MIAYPQNLRLLSLFINCSMDSTNTLLSFYSENSRLPIRSATRADTPTRPQDGHNKFLTFLAICCKLRVPIFANAWHQSLPNLGRGGTSIVSEGTALNSSVSYAFKRLLAPIFASAEEEARFIHVAYHALICEVALLATDMVKQHPNIIRLEGICFEVNETHGSKIHVWPVLIFEKAEWSTLEEFLFRCELGEGLDRDLREDLFVQILGAIAFMQETCLSQHHSIGYQ